jgi:5'-3' exonuclease
MIVDVSNLLHRTFFVHAKEEFENIVAMAYRSTFITLNMYYKAYLPDTIVLAFDDHNNWRKKYMKTDKSVSKRPYKGNRRQNMTTKQKEQYDMFLNFVDDFEILLKQHTSIICIKGDELEADDIISGFVEAFGEEHKVTILSQDKDLHQLLRTPNVQIVDPATKKVMTANDIDADFFIFEKCFRGDQGDNVQNAYPGIRTTTIKKAFEDSYEYANLLQQKWTDVVRGEFKVKELFEENVLLMDLTKQPEDIRDRMFEAIEDGFVNKSKYSHFHFLGFLGKYKLKEVSKQIEYLIPLLSR